MPWVTWNTNGTKKYTLVFYDIQGGFVHAMFVNIIGGSVSKASNEIFPYFPPSVRERPSRCTVAHLHSRTRGPLYVCVCVRRTHLRRPTTVRR